MASPVQTPDELVTRLQKRVGLGLVTPAQADRILAVDLRSRAIEVLDPLPSPSAR